MAISSDTAAAAAPIPVPPVIIHNTERPLSPNTTAQEDLVTRGQRRINMIWEVTQASIAIMVTLANMVVSIVRAVQDNPSKDYPAVLASAFFLIMGAYFQRTNHQRVGGIGPKATDVQHQPYTGR